MHNYQAEHGHLPPAVVYGACGQPLYSWRVSLLPYTDGDDLYKEFHLDEPWDSPHNLALLPRMPGVYAPPYHKRSRVPPHHTVCHVFVGEGAAFEGGEGLRYPGDFPDGGPNTFLVVEAGEPVPWTKPDDLVYDPDGPLPELRCLFQDGFRARTADGSGRFVRKGTSEATLRAAITRNGGDRLGPDW
jgi:uncharacterized protein DUF1559